MVGGNYPAVLHPHQGKYNPSEDVIWWRKQNWTLTPPICRAQSIADILKSVCVGVGVEGMGKQLIPVRRNEDHVEESIALKHSLRISHLPGLCPELLVCVSRREGVCPRGTQLPCEVCTCFSSSEPSQVPAEEPCGLSLQTCGRWVELNLWQGGGASTGRERGLQGVVHCSAPAFWHTLPSYQKLLPLCCF